ncbi:hypothetical protein Tco_1210400 [Tanacetum coccineum]
MTVEQFTKSLFKTTSSEYFLTPLRDESKGKGIATEEEPLNQHIPLLVDLKVEQEKSEPRLKALSEEEMKAHALKLAEYEAKRIQTDNKKRKRSSEILKEIFVQQEIIVDGMYRNIIPPQEVVGSRGLVITEPETGIFYYNENFDFAFHRESEFHLAIITQLIRLLDDF